MDVNIYYVGGSRAERYAKVPVLYYMLKEEGGNMLKEERGRCAYCQ